MSVTDTAADRPSSGQKLRNIQALRALAAWGVVFHHLVDALRSYVAPTLSFPHPEFGSFGVEIFFVISGYVMMMTVANRPVRPLAFLTERLVRISPPYWVLTLGTFGVVFAGLKMFSHKEATLGRLVSSLGYWPYFGPNGLENPVVFTGWTLNYEMMFYVLFALCLLLRTERSRITAICAVLSVAVLGQFLTEDPVLDYLGRDIIVGFALGVVLWPLANRVRLSRVSASAAMIAGVVVLAVCDGTPLRDWGHLELAISAGAFLIVAGAIALEAQGLAIEARWVIFQGDASYALYLIHPFVLQAVGKAAIVLGINRTLPGIYGTLALMIVAAAVAAAVFHVLFERPVHRYARRFLPTKTKAA